MRTSKTVELSLTSNPVNHLQANRFERFCMVQFGKFFITHKLPKQKLLDSNHTPKINHLVPLPGLPKWIKYPWDLGLSCCFDFSLSHMNFQHFVSKCLSCEMFFYLNLLYHSFEHHLIYNFLKPFVVLWRFQAGKAFEKVKWKAWERSEEARWY